MVGAGRDSATARSRWLWAGSPTIRFVTANRSEHIRLVQGMPDDQVALLLAKARLLASPVQPDLVSAERRADDVAAFRAASVRLDAILELDGAEVDAMVDEFDRLRHKDDPSE